MATKVITKTCESTNLTVYGINPSDYASGVKTISYIYMGDFAKATEKEKDQIKKELTSADFIPAQVVSGQNVNVTKYALTLDEFIKLSHVAADGEKLTDCITRTITVNTLCIYGVNPYNLEKVKHETTTYYGDYSKITTKERERLICYVSNTDFYPAYIKLIDTVDEKRVLSNAEFIKNAHIAQGDEIDD